MATQRQRPRRMDEAVQRESFPNTDPDTKKALAWTHQLKKARVFCLQPGHDDDSYADPSFRTVLSRGIQWAARRL